MELLFHTASFCVVVFFFSSVLLSNCCCCCCLFGRCCLLLPLRWGLDQVYVIQMGNTVCKQNTFPSSLPCLYFWLSLYLNTIYPYNSNSVSEMGLCLTVLRLRKVSGSLLNMRRTAQGESAEHDVPVILQWTDATVWVHVVGIFRHT